MNILNLTTALPSKDGTGADIASQHFIDAMKKLGHSVSVVGYQRIGDSRPFNDENNTIKVGKRHIEIKMAGYHPLIWGAIALFRRLPFTSAQFYSMRYIKMVKSLISSHCYDLILLDHSSQLYWLKPTIADHAKVAILAHNIEHEIFFERLKYTSNLLAKWVYEREAKLLKQIEDELAIAGHEIWTLTEHDARYFTKSGRKDAVRIFELPANVTEPVDPAHTKTYDISMIGSWLWEPNADGLHYFFDQIYPLLPSALSIRIAGRGAEWLSGKYKNVEYLDFVPNAREFLEQAKVVAIPSIRGGGIQIKSLEAIGLGLKVVATPFAMRGIVAPPTTVKLAESPGQFADCLQAAITKSITPDDFKSVSDWVQNRHNQFVNSVATALKSLSELE